MISEVPDLGIGVNLDSLFSHQMKHVLFWLQIKPSLQENKFG